jgi:hypothetical protein
VNAKVNASKTGSVSMAPQWLRQLFALLFGPGRTLTLAVILLATFSGGAWAVWRHVEKHVESGRDYRVTIDQVAITPPPDWVHSDIRGEVFRTACPPGRSLSSLDDGLAQRIEMAFRLHPWVAKATVTKLAGARVRVDIVYRCPVCMVEVANGSGVELMPVDGDGVWLPGEDFSQKQKDAYPCLSGIDRRPIQPVGHVWGDARVVDGAAIAAVLSPVWQQLKLYRVQALSHPGVAGERTAFELYTRAGTRIAWGYADTRMPGELSADEKVGRLVKYAAAHGGLDSGIGLDVHTLPAK